MARYNGGDDGDGSDGSSGGKKGRKGKHPKQPKPKHPRGRHGVHHGRGGHGGHRGGHKARVVHPGTFHEQAGAGSIGHASQAQPAGGHPAGSGMAVHLLRPPLGTGLGDVLLELVGEGTLTLGAWQRDQERVTNRAWRRPGGLARMGGL